MSRTTARGRGAAHSAPCGGAAGARGRGWRAVLREWEAAGTLDPSGWAADGTVAGARRPARPGEAGRVAERRGLPPAAEAGAADVSDAVLGPAGPAAIPVAVAAPLGGRRRPTGARRAPGPVRGRPGRGPRATAG